MSEELKAKNRVAVMVTPEEWAAMEAVIKAGDDFIDVMKCRGNQRTAMLLVTYLDARAKLSTLKEKT